MHSLERQSTDKHSETDKGKMRLDTLINMSVNICFWMHTVGTANANTVSPPWITLSGCYNYSSSNSTSNIQNNEPTQCFEKCPNSQSVGLKNMSCICNPLDTFDGIQINGHCNLPCPGKSVVYCGREGAGNDLISVYTRDGINLNTSYGYGYVEISGNNKIVNASDKTSLQYGYLCYDDFQLPGPNRCRQSKDTVLTWEEAIKQCNGKSARLITASEVSTCSAGSAIDGTYWIGIYREKPDFTTSTTVTSTSTTATSTSSSSSKPTLSFKTTTGSRPNHNSDTPVIEQISKASSSDGINVVTVAVPVAVIFVTILVVWASILICKKRKLLCFKERHKSVQTGEINKVSATISSDIKLDDRIQPDMSRREKRQRKRRKRKKEDERVHAANENGEIDSNTGNHAELGRYTNGDHIVLNERTQNWNVKSRYDETIYSNRPTTASDIHAIVTPVQEKRTDNIHRSDEVQNARNVNNNDSQIEKTKKHKRSGKRKKRQKNSVFDVPAEHPDVEGQTIINN